MKRVLVFCYFVFFIIVFIPHMVSGDSEPASQLWLTILFVIPLFLAAISILLYGLSYKPKRFTWFWKIVPFTLIAFVVVSWYWDFILYPEAGYPLSETVMATLFFLATLSPAFYISFRLGYCNIMLPDKLNLKFITIISLVAILCIATHFIPDIENKINIKVNYVAQFNKISRPADYDPNDNAACYYEKAFGLYVEQPERRTDIKAWPEDLPNDKQALLEDWVSANGDALEQLKQGTQEPYYWLEHKGSSMWDIMMPSLAQARSLAYVICSRAKLNATKGNLRAAFSDLSVCYRFSKHLTGPKSLIDQLVGIGIRALALQAGFQILDKTEPTPDLLKDFQLQLESFSDRQSYVIDFTADKFIAYDSIQITFTDDGKGGGHLYGTRLLENTAYLKQQLGIDMTAEQKHNLKKLERRQTTELADEIYEYLGGVVHKTPWQLHSEGRAIKKVIEEMTKDNPFLRILMPAAGRIMERSFRGKVYTDALITTLALLRYEAEKGQLPDNLDQLVSTGYLKKLPVDPFSGRILIYKRIDDDFTLYSFGADFDDDGGVRSKWGEGEEGGDQVFWPVSREQK